MIRFAFYNVRIVSKQVRHQWFVALCLWCLWYIPVVDVLLAQEILSVGTTLATVEVNSEQTLVQVTRSIQPTTVLTTQEIRVLGARQISDALVMVPGLFVRHYGGLGGLKTVSLRGMNSAQTMITFNGLRLNSAQNGGVDLSTIPAEMIEAIHVERGGKSALVGSGAMSGIVQFTPKQRLQETGITLDYGSFGEVLSNMHGGTTLGPLHLNAGVYAQYARGDYPFLFDQFGRQEVLRRDNGDFRTLQGLFSGYIQMKAWTHTSMVLLKTSARGAPGAVVQGSIEQALARLDEYDMLATHRATTSLNAQTTFEIAGLARIGGLRYRDPSATVYGAQGLDESYRHYDTQVMSVLSHQIHSGASTIMLSTRGEFIANVLSGRMLQTQSQGIPTRYSIAWGGYGEWWYMIDSLQSLRVQGALRYDGISDIGYALSPLIGCMYRYTLNQSIGIGLRSSVSRSFRAPSFNELYYLNFGNTNLQPEFATMLSAGIIMDGAFSGLEWGMEADVFTNRTLNYIQAIPISPVAWSAQNIGMVWSRGMEYAMQVRWNELGVQARLSYTRQRATDESSISKQTDIAYMPRELLGMMLGYTDARLSLGGSMQFTSFRWALPAQNPSSLLSSFWTINCFIEYAVPLFQARFTMRLSADNLFDERYMVIRNYPMPGRMVRAGVRLLW